MSARDELWGVMKCRRCSSVVMATANSNPTADRDGKVWIWSCGHVNRPDDIDHDILLRGHSADLTTLARRPYTDRQTIETDREHEKSPLLEETKAQVMTAADRSAEKPKTKDDESGDSGSSFREHVVLETIARTICMGMFLLLFEVICRG